MNYQMLKSIVDSLIQNFKCPDCGGGVSEKDIEIVGAAGKTINIDVGCPVCNKHTMVKAEVSSMNLGNMGTGDINKLREELVNRLGQIKGLNTELKIGKKEFDNTHVINDKEIIDLKNVLKGKNLSANDFLK